MFKKLLILSVFLSWSLSAVATDSPKLSVLNTIIDYKDLLRLDWPWTASSEGPISLTEEMKHRIIIVGDSWAVFPCDMHSLDKVIAQNHSKIHNDERCKSTSRLGIEAGEWLGSIEDKVLTDILKSDQRIKYMYLSLGGNDLLSQWTSDMTAAEEQQLTDKIMLTLQKIMDKYIAISPDLKIVLSGYDYPHFKQNHPIPLYKRIYKKMGEPGAYRINTALADFSRRLVQVVDYKNKYFIHHLGLAHYYDGVGPTVLGLPTTNAPDQISTFDHPEMIGGDLYSKSREQSMMLWLRMFYDAFHLNEQNYYNVMLHTYDNLLVNIIP